MSEQPEKLKKIKIVKHDGRVHFAPSSAKMLKSLNYQNNLLAPDKRSRITPVELTQEEMDSHPAIEHGHASSASDPNVALLKKQSESQAKKIAELEKQLAEVRSGAEANAAGSKPSAAKDLIALIEKAETAQEVDSLVGDDTRIAITKAADKRKQDLSNNAL